MNISNLSVMDIKKSIRTLCLRCQVGLVRKLWTTDMLRNDTLDKTKPGLLADKFNKKVIKRENCK